MGWGVGLWTWMAVAAASEGREVAVSLGAQRVLSLPGVTRVAVGNPAVAEVKSVGDSQILVTGLREGRTSLLVWTGRGVRRSWRITVRKQDVDEIAAEVRTLLAKGSGVSVRVAGSRVLLEGSASSPEVLERVDRALRLYPSAQSRVSGGPDAHTRAAKRMAAALERAGLPHLQVRPVEDTLFVEGSVESAQELQKLGLLLKASGEKTENLAAVGLKRMIESEVHFVEVRRGSRDRVGIKYPTDVVGQVGAQASAQRALFGAGAAGALNLEAAVRADGAVGFQFNDGYARLLAQPRLVCASGEKAEFLAGGQVPIPLITQNQLAVQYKEYGIILKIRPTADRFGHIQTEIEAEASEVDAAVAVSVGGSVQVPGFRTRKVNTNVTVSHGETIILSGVFSHDEQKSVSKLHGLGHLPLLGELFKSRGFDFGYRELVIFVTPRIVAPGSERTAAAIKAIQTRYRQARQDVRFNIFD